MYQRVERPLYRIDVELDEKIYGPGQIITGKVHLQLDKKLYCDQITVQFYGSARVFWIEDVVKPGALRQRCAYEQRRVFVDEKKDVWQSDARNRTRNETSIDQFVRNVAPTRIHPERIKVDPNRPCIEAGRYEYPFQFEVPKTGLATSFDAAGAVGCIRYYIQVLIQRVDSVIMRRKHLFPIVCPADLNTNTRSMESPEKTEEVKLGRNNGTVSATLRLHKRGLVPGEPIRASINVRNEYGIICGINTLITGRSEFLGSSKKSIKYVHLNISQRTNAYADTPQMSHRETIFETSGETRRKDIELGVGLPVGVMKIAAGSSLSYRPQFHVPALVPNFDLGGCITVEYSVNLYVGTIRGKRSGILIHLQIPILIGTVPVSFVLEDLNNDGTHHLPTYEELSQAEKSNAYLRLPTYAESVAGRSAIGEKEDNNDGSNDAYCPLYYQYQFEEHEAEQCDTQKLL